MVHSLSLSPPPPFFFFFVCVCVCVCVCFVLVFLLRQSLPKKHPCMSCNQPSVLFPALSKYQTKASAGSLWPAVTVLVTRSDEGPPPPNTHTHTPQPCWCRQYGLYRFNKKYTVLKCTGLKCPKYTHCTSPCAPPPPRTHTHTRARTPLLLLTRSTLPYEQPTPTTSNTTTRHTGPGDLALPAYVTGAPGTRPPAFPQDVAAGWMGSDSAATCFTCWCCYRHLAAWSPASGPSVLSPCAKLTARPRRARQFWVFRQLKVLSVGCCRRVCVCVCVPVWLPCACVCSGVGVWAGSNVSCAWEKKQPSWVPCVCPVYIGVSRRLDNIYRAVHKTKTITPSITWRVKLGWWTCVTYVWCTSEAVRGRKISGKLWVCQCIKPVCVERCHLWTHSKRKINGRDGGGGGANTHTQGQTKSVCGAQLLPTFPHGRLSTASFTILVGAVRIFCTTQPLLAERVIALHVQGISETKAHWGVHLN